MSDGSLVTVRWLLLTAEVLRGKDGVLEGVLIMLVVVVAVVVVVVVVLVVVAAVVVVAFICVDSVDVVAVFV